MAELSIDTPCRPAIPPPPSTMIIVDADPTSRLLYAEHFRRAGSDVEEADEGRIALAKAISRRPDALVTAARLPFVSGIELCRLLRQDPLTSEMTIVVAAEVGRQHDADVATRAGADAVLVSPFEPDTLVSTVGELFRQSRLLRERSRAINARGFEQLKRANELIERAGNVRERMMSHTHNRRQTATPPLEPPTLRCSLCDAWLAYRHSQIGGVSARHSEQWDYFECTQGCGVFQYRHRTRTIRHIE